MAILQPNISFLSFQSCNRCPFDYRLKPISKVHSNGRSKSYRLVAKAESDEDYLIDAPVSIGDGFSFSGGKYSNEPDKCDDWFRQGKIVKAHPVDGTGGKAKDPFFGLTMGGVSQASVDLFRVHHLKHALCPCFCAIDGSALKMEMLPILQLF